MTIHVPDPWTLAPQGPRSWFIEAPGAAGGPATIASMQCDAATARRITRCLHLQSELLLALKRMCAELTDQMEADFGREMRPTDMPRAWHEAKAVIAKAEGR
jgi:hypothetical protein